MKKKRKLFQQFNRISTQSTTVSLCILKRNFLVSIHSGHLFIYNKSKKNKKHQHSESQNNKLQISRHTDINTHTHIHYTQTPQ